MEPLSNANAAKVGLGRRLGSTLLLDPQVILLG